MAKQLKALSVAGATIWFATCYGGTTLAYLAINAAAGRLLKEDFGQFVIVLTLTTLLGQLGLVGVHRGGLREAARLQCSDVGVLAELRRGVRIVSLLTLPLLSCATAVVSFLLVDDYPISARVAIALCIGLLVWWGGQQKLWANFLRGFGEVRFASLLEGRSGGLLVAACQALLLAAILFLVPQSGLPGALAALVAGFAAPVIMAWRRVNRRWRQVPVTLSLWRDLKAVIRKNWHFASNLAAGSISASTEIWLAGLMLSNAGLSQFSAAQRLSLLLAFPLVSLGIVYSPLISRLYGRDDQRLEALLRTGATVAAAVTAIAWIPMLLLPAPILEFVYGSWFSAAAPLLALLTLGSLTTMLSGLSSTALTMSRHEAVVGYVQWTGVAARLVLGAAAAIAFGATGLAASSAAISASLSIALWLVAFRRLGLRTHFTLKPSMRLMFKTAA